MEIWKLIADLTSEKNTVHFQKSQMARVGFITLKLDKATIVLISDWKNEENFEKEKT